jgi:predicted nucleotidyltransferase
MSSNNIIDELRSIIEKYKDHIIFAYLFGSAAKNDLRPLSDIDIAIFLRKGKKGSYFDLKLTTHSDICRVLKRDDIDVVILNITTNIMLLDEIIRNGVVLFDGDKDLREEFELKILHQAIDFKEQRKALVGV